jgi:DNA (cytosine-5)-methyltransferase 1
MKELTIGTVFSGIGAFEQSLTKLGLKYKTVFACDNGEREIPETKEKIDAYGKTHHLNNAQLNDYVAELYDKSGKPNRMKESYLANYSLKGGSWYEDIRFIDGEQYHGEVDVFVGGSPCQSFSIMGKKAGLKDVRGTLFYDYARLINEIKPKVFIYENVPGMLAHDKGNTWKVIKDVFESLGYELYGTILNSSDYGIPQNRRRLFVVGFARKGSGFSFPQPTPLQTTMFDYLEEHVEAKRYLGQKGFEFVTNPKYKNRARVNRDIIQTEKANQQFNWNGDFVFEDLTTVANRPDIMARAFVGHWEGRQGVIRQLTHRECMRLMGFPDTYKIVVPNVWAYRQAGNSIVVNVLSALMTQIVATGVFDDAD